MSNAIALWTTIVIFAFTYAGLAFGRLPWLRTDRPGIALVGAALVLCCGLLTFEEAIRAVDFATLILLLGMMIVVAYLRRGGFFEVLANWSLGCVRNPVWLLAVIMSLSAILSALLVNDVVCLALTPLVLHLVRQMNLDPRPHLIGLAVASNIGSVATLTGNPQNMMIGGFSQIGYLHFAVKLTPVAVLSLAVAFVVTWFVFRSALQSNATVVSTDPPVERPRRRKHRALLIKSLTVTVAAVSLFFAGFSMAVVGLAAAAVLLLDRVKPEKAYKQVDWGLLVMFAGLFVVVQAFEVHVLKPSGIQYWSALEESPISLLSVVSAVMSNIVSNVPAVLLFKPIILAMPLELRETAWLSLAMSSTMAGNLTILGSVANLIVVEIARKSGVAISLYDYCKVGVPVTVLTLLIGIGWLRFFPY